jgi:hypothetical protein
LLHAADIRVQACHVLLVLAGEEAQQLGQLLSVLGVFNDTNLWSLKTEKTRLVGV